MLIHIHDALRRLPKGSVFPTAESSRLTAALTRLVGRETAKRLMSAAGKTALARMPATEMAAAADVPLRAAERVVAARDVGEALFASPGARLRHGRDAAECLPAGFSTLEYEVLLGLALNARLSVKAIVLFGKGGDVGVSVGVRDIFVPLVRLSAAAFVLAHNHPSGDPVPSPEDVMLTNTVAKVGKVLGIELVDHLIVGSEGTFSFHDADLLPSEAELAS